MKKEIKKFEELLIQDGVDPDVFENLHEVCDPNQYAADVLQLEVSLDTLLKYNEFAEEWDAYIIRKKKNQISQ